jgi:hypothetical protein
MIPRLIHQVWHPRAAEPMPPEWVRFAASWQQHHPGFRYRLWQPQESLAFVAQHHPAFLPIYQALQHPMQRAEALHLLLLHHWGGLCVGLDVECLRNVEPLLAGSRLVLAAEPQAPGQHAEGGQQAISTAFIASEPGHPFWSAALADLQRGATAGPALLTRCHAQWAEQQHASITVLAPETLHPVSEPAYRDPCAPGIETWARATAPAYAVHHRAHGAQPAGTAHPPAQRPYHAGMPLRLKHPALARVRPGQLFCQGPLASCIMVSRGSSHPARWSIQCFRNQSYTQRELLVVTTQAGGDLQQHIAGLEDPRIRFVGVLPAGTPPGDLLNTAVGHATGAYVCLWSEDDLSGADRLAACMTALLTTSASAALLQRVGLWQPAREQLGVATPPAGPRTLVARRDALPRFLGTDTVGEAQALDTLVAAHPVALIDDPNLYLQVAWRAGAQGSNTPGTDACGGDAPARDLLHLAEPATLSAEGPACEPLLSVLDRHYPVVEYLQWLREHDPGTFAAASARPPVAHQRKAPPSPRPSRADAGEEACATAGPPRTVMMAWELGGGLGHMVPLSQVARPLLEAGHTVHMVLTDLSGVPAALGALADHPRLHLWQAPYWPSPLFGSADPASYAELLFRAGYLDAQRLAGLVQGWATLLDQLNPDLLLVDHAPTALLAARGRPLRRAQFGTGFFIPLMETPIPSYREWEPVPRARVERSEALVLQTCNAILFQRGQPLLDHLHQLFDCDETFLVTVPELDHFERRSRAARQPGLPSPYWGSLASASHGQPPQWPAGTGPALFVYLKSDYRALGSVLTALKETLGAGWAQPGPGGTMKAGPWRVLAYVPGLNAATVAAASGPGLHIVVDPVDMQAVCGSCDAVLCQSGSGTVATALHAGRPVLMLPMHMEQLLFARRVQALGAGLYLTEDRIAQLPALLQRLATQPGFGDAARAFARRHAQPGGNRVAQAIAARCVQLMGGTRTPPDTPGVQAAATAPALVRVPAAP